MPQMDKGRTKEIAETAEKIMEMAGEMCLRGGLDPAEMPFAIVTAATICMVRLREKAIGESAKPLAQYVVDSLIVSLRRNDFPIVVTPDNKETASSGILLPAGHA